MDINHVYMRLLCFSVKRCGLPTWPNNGNLVCDGYFYGKNCTVECLPGYQLDSKGSHEITCEERGDWSRDTPSCNRK